MKKPEDAKRIAQQRRKKAMRAALLMRGIQKVQGLYLDDPKSWCKQN